MNRRTLLAKSSTVLAGTAALSGCTETTLEEAEYPPNIIEQATDQLSIDLPVPQQLDIAADRVETATAAEITSLEELDAFLTTQRLDIRTLDESTDHYQGTVAPAVDVREHEPVIDLSYIDQRGDDRGLMHHLGLVSGGYASLLEETDLTAVLVATIETATGEEYGEYSIRPAWADSYTTGSRSARSYVDVILTELQARKPRP